MIDVRCKGCNRLLAVAKLFDGAIKCHKCKGLYEYKIFNNMFVTNQYDPNVKKGLRLIKPNDTVQSESDEDHQATSIKS